jgi:hypothetical protein
MLRRSRWGRPGNQICRSVLTFSNMQRMHSMPRLLVVLVVFCTSISAFSAPRSKVENISGRIVVYANPLTCLNGNSYWSMIIHVQDPRDISSEFIQVPFSVPCSEAPGWLPTKSSFQTFRLIREKDSDSVLKEFMECGGEPPSGGAPQPCPTMPIWRRVPGTERYKLPFGQRVPCYRSVDLPLAPVV